MSPRFSSFPLLHFAFEALSLLRGGNCAHFSTMKTTLSLRSFNFLLSGKQSWSTRPPHGDLGIGPAVLGALDFLCHGAGGSAAGAGRR